MGVLYHRRSPLEHLWQLKDQLVNGGELVLETNPRTPANLKSR
jgi:tRNA (mo5U34)-methyltransferase